MNSGFWFALGGLILLASAQRDAYRVWKGSRSLGLERLSTRGQRALPVAITLGWPFLGSALLMYLVPHIAVVFLWVSASLLVALLVPSTYFLGRPRLLVPPRLRTIASGTAPPREGESQG